VGEGSEIVWAEDLAGRIIEKKTPVAPDTRFRIGTASTPLTSAAAGLLLEQGRLNLDEPIQKYVPEFPEKQSTVTLRQVMGHLAGLRTTAVTRVNCFRSTAIGRSMHCSTSRGVRFGSSRAPSTAIRTTAGSW
jgi:CubicO group peptidase (beta-lactamase class C family)